MTREDKERFYELVYAADRALARACGEFLTEHFFEAVRETVMETNDGRRMPPNASAMKNMILFFIESELPSGGRH